MRIPNTESLVNNPIFYLIYIYTSLYYKFMNKEVLLEEKMNTFLQIKYFNNNDMINNF